MSGTPASATPPWLPTTAGIDPPTYPMTRPEKALLTKLAAYQYIPLSRFLPTQELSEPVYDVPDEELTAAQLFLAYGAFLRCIEDVGWRKDYVDSFKSFYIALGDARAQKGDAAVVKYHASVRRDWHYIMNCAALGGKSEIFDIGRICEKRMQDTHEDARFETLKKRGKELDAATEGLRSQTSDLKSTIERFTPYKKRTRNRRR